MPDHEGPDNQFALDPWPGLTHPNPDAPVSRIREALNDRIRSGRYERPVFTPLYRGWRWVRQLLSHFQATVLAQPVRTSLDFLTSLPIGAIAFPAYRDWLFSQNWGHEALVALILARVGFSVWMRHQKREMVKTTVRSTQVSTLPTVEMAFSCAHAAIEGKQLTGEIRKKLVEGVLQAIVNVTRLGLQLDQDVRVHANLMLPMPVVLAGSDTRYPGIGIVAYNEQKPADRSHTKVLVGDLVAGEVFASGVPQVVEDTHDPDWCAVFDHLRVRSFVSFPLRDSSERVIGCVNVDSDRAMTFKRSAVMDQLWPVIAPQLAVLAEILASRSEILADKRTKSLRAGVPQTTGMTAPAPPALLPPPIESQDTVNLLPAPVDDDETEL